MGLRSSVGSSTVVDAYRDYGVRADGTDQATRLQNFMNALRDAGPGHKGLLPPGVIVSAGTIFQDTYTAPAGHGRGTVIKLGDNSGVPLWKTRNFDALTPTDNATAGGVPHDFAIRDVVFDGNKANQASLVADALVSLYGFAFDMDGFVIRNAKSRGLFTQHSTQSVSTGMENSMPATMDRFIIHSCDREGWEFRGPHDTQVGDRWFLFQNNMLNGGSQSQLWVPDSGGRANGTQFGRVHAWGGYSSYGVIIASSGVRMQDPIIEGGTSAQLWIDVDQVQVRGAHLYTGGVNTATAKGLVLGHSGAPADGVVFEGRIENCGGGSVDLTYVGGHCRIDVDTFYYSGVTPSRATAGHIGTPPVSTAFRERVNDGTFTPTTDSLETGVGPLWRMRAIAGDTREMLRLFDQAYGDLFKIDRFGHVIAAGAVPSFAVGSQIGSGGVVSASAGKDTAGTITFTTGSTVVAGQMVAVTFGGAYPATPKVVLFPNDAASAALLNAGQIFVTKATTGFSLRAGVAPAASTAYSFDYVVIGV